MLWNHIKLHPSQTAFQFLLILFLFYYHIKLHTSQTGMLSFNNYSLFYCHIKLHTSQTHLSIICFATKLWNHTKLHTSQTRCCRYDYIWALEPYKITHLSNGWLITIYLHGSFGTIQNYTPLKHLSLHKIENVVWQPYKITHLSNPNIICKKEILEETAKEKRAK